MSPIPYLRPSDVRAMEQREAELSNARIRGWLRTDDRGCGWDWQRECEGCGWPTIIVGSDHVFFDMAGTPLAKSFGIWAAYQIQADIVADARSIVGLDATAPEVAAFAAVKVSSTIAEQLAGCLAFLTGRRGGKGRP